MFGNAFWQFSILRPSVLVLLCCSGTLLSAQSAPTASPQTPSAVLRPDPTQPEAQPNLSVERDPVLSPDPQDNMPVNPAAVQNKQRPEELQKQQDNIYTLHRDVDEVLLNCTVVDEKGQLVTDLDRRNFSVWEDNVPQTIASFQHQDLPVSMGILIDNSGSMRDKRAAVNTAALDLVRASNREDTAFIVNFSDDAYIDQDLTSDINALERGLSHVDSRGSTALYDTVAASANELSSHAKQPKQVLLIITDGEDNASRLDLRQAIRRVQNLGGPVVYSIGLLFGEDNKDKSRRAREALETLSQETGGIAYFPRSLQEINEIAAQVAHDIRNQYTIGYHSTRPAALGGYRVVHVEAKTSKHGKLIVRTRNGYYPKQAQHTQTAQTTQASPQ
jgi:Ca-activated chloride channel homolog